MNNEELEFLRDMHYKNYDSEIVTKFLNDNKLSKLDFIAFGTDNKPTYDILYRDKGNLNAADFNSWLSKRGLKVENNKIEIEEGKEEENKKIRKYIKNILRNINNEFFRIQEENQEKASYQRQEEYNKVRELRYKPINYIIKERGWGGGKKSRKTKKSQRKRKPRKNKKTNRRRRR
jgi:hypothetical protein